MKWDQQWQKKAAEEQLRRQGRRLVDYPWPEDKPDETPNWVEKHGKGNRHSVVRYGPNDQIVIYVR